MIFDREQLGRTGNSIYNDEIRLFLSDKINTMFSDSVKFNDMVNLDGFISEIQSWIGSSKYNIIHGLSSFEVKVISLGVTQTLDQFHYDILQNRKRLRLFKGEYPYNRDVHPFSYSSDFIDDFPLQKGDAVIISCPFSGTGAPHKKMSETLDQCHNLEIPALIDLAWFGTCGGLEIDLSHPAITHVAFSLTKGLTCGNFRSGIRFTRKLESLSKRDRLYLQHQWNHSVHLNAAIGRTLMKEFGPDTQFNKYRDAQIKVCEHFSIQPSPCVHIATSEDSSWNDFDRDGTYNRINLRDAIKKYLHHPADL